jgi:glycosyltransferase involved in cell wall biosynthesis
VSPVNLKDTRSHDGISNFDVIEMRICRISKRVRPQLGGIENHVYLLSIEQKRMGHDVRMILPSGPYERLRSFMNLYCITGFSLNPLRTANGVERIIETMKNLIFAFSAIIWGFCLFMSWQFDVVHGHGDRLMAMITAIIGGVTGSKTAITVHSDIADCAGPVRGFPYALVERHIAVSGKIGHQLEMIGARKKPCVISSGVSDHFIDTPAEYNTDSRLVVFVGRLRESKGIDVLLRSWKNVQEEIADAKLAIVGTGKELTALKKLSSDLGIRQSVAFKGYLDTEELAHFLKSASIFVMPSISTSGDAAEGRPTAIMEAMCLGIPTIGSNVGGIPEIVDDGRTGYVVPEGDSYILSNKLVSLLRDDKLRTAMSKACREIRTRVAWPSIAQEVTNCYND